MKTIFIMLDSLNRHYLNTYGFPKVITPNIDRLSQKSLTFDAHYIGSAPCMPARRELMTGRLNFLETPWSPIQPWDDCLPVELRKKKGVYSHMITDHYHYFHSGGEAYHTLFDSYEFFRGQEHDVWHPFNQTANPDTLSKRDKRQMAANRSHMDVEDDLAYSTPQCFASAVEFLKENQNTDNWHLHIEAFDPHEPFVCPSKYLKLYNDTYTGKDFYWSDYKPVTEGPEAVAHIRNRYMATLTMADHWLGKFLDAMDAFNMWKDTALVFTTDHGHMLGEHGYWAKGYMMCYEELTHIPLMIYHPDFDNENKQCTSLTATMDIMPTFMEMHGASLPEHVQGQSLMHLLSNPEEPHKDAVLFGYYGADINLFDGRYTYCRQALEGSIVHHHTAMPRAFSDFIGRKELAGAEFGIFLNSTYQIPHYRIADVSRQHHNAPDYNPIYDVQNDPFQTKPILDDALENRLAEKMLELLRRYDAPECQYSRMGFVEQ